MLRADAVIVIYDSLQYVQSKRLHEPFKWLEFMTLIPIMHADAANSEHQQIPTMQRDMGEPQVIQQDRMSLGAAVGQMFIIGMPFAIAFASVALYLWRRLGDLKPLPRRLPTSDPGF